MYQVRKQTKMFQVRKQTKMVRRTVKKDSSKPKTFAVKHTKVTMTHPVRRVYSSTVMNPYAASVLLKAKAKQQLKKAVKPNKQKKKTQNEKKEKKAKTSKTRKPRAKKYLTRILKNKEEPHDCGCGG